MAIDRSEDRTAVVDELVRESLTSLVADVSSSNWKGREHEVVSRYVIGHLAPRFGRHPLFRRPTQICIHGTVPGVPGRNPKGRVNKDLQIWPPEYESCWDDDWRPTRVPLAILEWKVFRPRTKRLTMSRYDIDWLRAFSELHEGFVGYAVSLDVAGRDRWLSVTRVASGVAQDDWLTL